MQPRCRGAYGGCGLWEGHPGPAAEEAGGGSRRKRLLAQASFTAASSAARDQCQRSTAVPSLVPETTVSVLKGRTYQLELRGSRGRVQPSPNFFWSSSLQRVVVNSSSISSIFSGLAGVLAVILSTCQVQVMTTYYL